MTVQAPRIMPAPTLPRRYPHRHLNDWTDDDWRRLPVTRVTVTDLVPSQQGLDLRLLAHLVNGGTTESGDAAGRAIRYDGVLNLHDGHHRWVIALLRGEPDFPVRIYDADPL